MFKDSPGRSDIHPRVRTAVSNYEFILLRLNNKKVIIIKMLYCLRKKEKEKTGLQDQIALQPDTQGPPIFLSSAF